MLNQFKNLSCYEEFEIQCALIGISKIDVLKEIGHQIDNYYFFISHDGIFNWFDLEGNHVENPGILKELKEEHIPLSISKCIIPDSVTSISDKAFSYCGSLTSINIPNSVTSIGVRAFYFCDSLKEINIPNNVTSIGYDAFCRCTSLTSIAIPNSVTSISDKAFYGCISLKEITIPNSVISIGDKAFEDCDSLKQVIFSSNSPLLNDIKNGEY
jgi:hypothetical protein